MNHSLKKFLLVIALLVVFFLIPFLITRNIPLSFIIALVAMVVAK